MEPRSSKVVGMLSSVKPMMAGYGSGNGKHALEVA